MAASILLVIDDHPQVLQHRKNTLQAFGYSVITATSASAAISVLASRVIGAVLMEYRFEGIDAEAVACLLKKRFPTTPIILLSAYSAMPERILWLVDDYVMRSDPIETLVKKIKGFTPAENSDNPKSATPCDKPTPPKRSVA